ncbi:zinc finger and SCAN domain-containing protein 31-like [Hemicordylus capensis]|uniref:zinc finger and SCAN domain-containing protein 31-like n=1 Tax=Hemicordylus capensis TaxID=884348 RepID=UPI002303C99D|nr:zinc finger and SCAN domain-containing protein 31-like [Hemicordylus capensis]XP_053146242.1 zinc finger and SCAN domain-containing protein 31-like [Hemicordylus capensis]
MKMEEQDSEGHTQGEGSQGVRKDPPVLKAVSVGKVLQRIPEVQVKQEPCEGLLQHWEAQWQEFLKTVESPHSGWGIPQLPEELAPWDDAKAFLASFEQVAEACRWPREAWVARLLPALSGEAKQAFIRLEAKDQEDYGKVKAAILRGDAISREKQRQHFRCFCYKEAEGPRGAYSQLQELCFRWLKVERHSKEQILELLILEQFLTILPTEIQRWVRQWGPETCSQAVALAEDFLQVQQESSRWEQQALTKLEEAPVSSLKAAPPPSGPIERHVQREAEQDEDGSSRLLSYMSASECGEKILESSELVELDGASRRRVTENISQHPELGRAFENRHSSKRQQRSPPRSRISQSVLDVANKTLSESLLGHNEEPCAVTEEGFKEDSGLPRYGRDHNQEAFFQCMECGKSLSHKDQFVRHQRIHALEKPRKCSYCGKSFCQRSNLIFHERSHTEEKPFQCSACGKCFSRNSLLIKHERTHGGEKPYTCSMCGKGFVYSWNLIKHKKKHTGEKPHQCSACGKTFFERSDLIRHERTHTGEKPYKCTVCERSFSQKWLLIKHERTHTV